MAKPITSVHTFAHECIVAANEIGVLAGTGAEWPLRSQPGHVVTIRRKLIGGYAALVAIPAIVGIVSILVNDRVQREVVDLSAHAYAEIRSAHELARAIDAVEARLRQLSSAREAKSLRGPAAPGGPIRTARAALDQALIALRRAIDEATQPSLSRAGQNARAASGEQDELALLDQLKAAAEGLEAKARALDSSLEVTSVVDAQQSVDALLAEIGQEVSPRLDLVRQDAEREMADSSEALANIPRVARRLEIAGTLAALVVAVIVGTLMARAIFGPIVTLRDAARRMGQGNLETPVSLQSRDEMSMLGDALEQMARNLRHTMSALTTAIEERDRVQADLRDFNDTLERTVHERTEQLQRVIDVAPVGAALYRLFPNDRLIFTGANRSADRILKVDTRQFIGKTIEEAFPAIAATSLPGLCRSTVRDGIPRHVGPLSYEENGINGSFELDLVQLGPDRLVLFFRDITELLQAYDDTLVGWSRAMDVRDRETEGHTQRVTEMTIRLARAMGIGDAELVHARWGALLHDIGKIGVPDNILLKPGPLTKEEWVVMRRHPETAREMLKPIGFLRQALSIPYCHHEKWDGTGYPRGLIREQIPLIARIFAVADVWDALRHDRPYHLAWTPERARAYIRSKAGTHFDPAVVDAFECAIAADFGEADQSRLKDAG
jgi:putative nucleotidyltransferase with HDIG domain